MVGEVVIREISNSGREERIGNNRKVGEMVNCRREGQFGGDRGNCERDREL